MRSNSTPEELLEFDATHIWHPYAPMPSPNPVGLVHQASGVHLELSYQNQQYRAIDGMSSWWAAIHGYRHPKLDAAAHHQIDQLAHVMFGGLTHQPAIELAKKLVAMTPAGLEKVFFADTGSVSVEVALKMALQVQLGRGKVNRNRFLTIAGGYHGDTFAAMSVCDPNGGMHELFTGFLTPQVFAPRPPSSGDITAWGQQFRELAAANQTQLAGIIVEPILQGAGGMYCYPAACLTVFREVADEFDLVLIFDEIATGFGRTGTMFAADSATITPDILCVGKALTGGYLTGAATICTAEIADAVAASPSGALLHGPTFMGNPLSCAIANANLELLATGAWKQQVSSINQSLRSGLAELVEHPAVAEVRTIGAVGVVQLHKPVEVTQATIASLAKGVWLRPFRDLIYTMPPYLCSPSEIAQICQGMKAAVLAQ